MNVRELEHKLNENGIVFTFTGAISYKTLSTSGAFLKECLRVDNSFSNEDFKVYAVFIELLQNIMNYSAIKRSIDAREVGVGTCLVQYNKQSESISVLAGNLVHTTDGEKVGRKINQINSLDPVALKHYYKEVRRGGKDTHDFGSGLGFLDMARKSQNKLQYLITQEDEHFSYFEIKVDI